MPVHTTLRLLFLGLYRLYCGKEETLSTSRAALQQTISGHAGGASLCTRNMVTSL